MSHSPSDQACGQAGFATLPESVLHRLLTSDRRRVVLELLKEQPLPIDTEELAILVARRSTDVDGIESDVVDRIALTLHHEHLPTLADAGIVEYQPASNSIESYRELVR
jgi:predicted transcriptional regulator